MTVAYLDPLADPRWAAFVRCAPEADVFHHPAWLSLLHEHYRYPMQALCVLEHGEIVAGLPLARVESRLTGRRLVAVPFSDRCVPLGGVHAVQHLGEALVAQRALSGWTSNSARHSRVCRAQSLWRASCSTGSFSLKARSRS